MKKILLVLFFSFLFAGFVSAQYTYTPNTYYFIPPTSGCDGVWAIQWNDSICGPGATYLWYPCGSFSNCWNGSHQDGDTLFLNVCCLPCSVTVMDNAGHWCDSVAVDFASGIQKNISGILFRISPNPTNNNFTITFPRPLKTEAKLKIYDMTGREVMEEKISSQVSAFNFQLSGGVYFVRVSDGEKVEVQKLVVG